MCSSVVEHSSDKGKVGGSIPPTRTFTCVARCVILQAVIWYEGGCLRRRAVFLDRDGTVVRGVSRPELCPHATGPWLINELQFEPNLREAVKIFQSLGYLVILATNQPDMAYGKIPKARWAQIHKTILAEVQPDDCFICFHRRQDNCLCKKPKPGMLLDAAEKWNINLRNSFMIGDTGDDVRAGKAAGCKTIIISRHYNQGVGADFRVSCLLAAASVV